MTQNTSRCTSPPLSLFPSPPLTLSSSLPLPLSPSDPLPLCPSALLPLPWEMSHEDGCGRGGARLRPPRLAQFCGSAPCKPLPGLRSRGVRRRLDSSLPAETRHLQLQLLLGGGGDFYRVCMKTQSGPTSSLCLLAIQSATWLPGAVGRREEYLKGWCVCVCMR